ncbi:MAG: response regulator [Candidatus Viridilinea halotolerans]|uniref:Response regulator n=1 Tax=Candidatus Viridilinea halotolerans TaxID=2491704 RepID=A0A426TUB9_9CHLR|nr:MAG: response regulator [Candidatus Viridilinea halotolerans]
MLKVPLAHGLCWFTKTGLLFYTQRHGQATMSSILIVEDELLVAMDTKALLSNHGYSVPAVATSGGDAVRQALNLRPDLILMDIRLRGEMDGIAAADQILTHYHVPVIYLTAFADDMTLLRARATAPYGYLVKPFDEATLLASISMAVERHRRDSQASARAELLSSILDGAGDAVVAVDANGMVTYLNGHAAAMIQQDRTAAVGHPVAALLPLRDPASGSLVPPPALDALLGTVLSPRPRILDLCLPGHSPRRVLVGTAPTGGPSSQAGAVMIIWDQPSVAHHAPAPPLREARPAALPPLPPRPSPEARQSGQASRLSAACASLIAPGWVDRPLKLHLLLVLYQHSQLRHNAISLSEWLKEPPWEVQSALNELAEAGLLYRSAEQPHPAFHVAATAENSGVAALARAFDDPELRQLLLTRVRAADQERVMRQTPPWEFIR